MGIFADFPSASTGFAVVCRNIAEQLSSFFDLEVYYFGRYGTKSFSLNQKAQLQNEGFYYIPSIGGVWDSNYVRKLIEKWKLDCLFSEDDWFNALGLVIASRQTNKPLHFLTPIDALPIPKSAISILSKVTKVYVPNSSYKCLNEKGIDAMFLPHAVDYGIFYPTKQPKDEIVFLWIGRDEERKALGRTILAFRNVMETLKFPVDVKLLIRTDWRYGNSKMFIMKHMPKNVIMDQTSDVPHNQLNFFYNRGDIFVCSSKAGGFEMGIIEANAVGLPALVTNHPFMNEIVREGINGWRVDIAGYESDPRRIGQWGNISIEDLTAHMLQCVKSIDEIRSHASSIRNFASSNYSWKDISKKLYRSIIE